MRLVSCVIKMPEEEILQCEECGEGDTFKLARFIGKILCKKCQAKLKLEGRD